MTDAQTTATPLPTDDSGRIALILDIVAKETGVDRERLHFDQDFAELGIPSLDMVQTVFELESRFGIEVPVLTSDGGGEFRTVGDLVRHVLKSIHQQGRV